MPKSVRDAAKHDPWCLCVECERRDDDRVARAFHEAYERLAPEHGYDTRPETRLSWAQLPKNNRALMRATVHELIERKVIRI